MGTVSGIVRDTQGNAAPGATVTVAYQKALVGYNGGAAVQNTRVFETDGTGLLTMADLIPGHYEISFAIPANDTTTQTVMRTGALTVLEADQTLEAALDSGIGEITPSSLQQAAASAQLAEDWAEGTEPGGAGTKSAKEHALDAKTYSDALGGAAELQTLASDAQAAEAGAVAAQGAAETARDLSEAYAGVVSRATSVADLTDPTTLTAGDKGYVSGSGDDAVDGLYEVQASAWVRIGSTGLANATYARSRMVTDVFRRSADKAADRLTQRRSIYDTLVSAARSRLLRSAASSDVYCDPSATGANDGTSWADAFTDLDAAFNAMSNGDRLFIDGDFGSTVTVTLASNLEGPEVITDRGATGYTKFDGRIYAGDVVAGTFADEGGGRFSIPLASEPKAVAFNLTQDDTSGTVTGVDLTATRKANLISEWSRGTARMAAWYGFLKKSASATTTPAEGEWSYTGGNLYIFPSGSPTLAEVNSGACWADGASGLKITGAELTGAYIHGDLWTFFTPSPDGNSGCGLELENARFVTVEGHWADLWGYHATGFAASSKNGNVAIKCTASGAMPADNTSSGALAYVFFTQVGNFYSDGARGHDLFFNAYPLLDQSGAPINTKFSPQIGYHHTGGGYTLTDVQWTYPCQIDHNSELAAKHSVTLTSSPAFVGGGSFSNVGDVNDSTPWEAVVRYGKGDGEATFPQPKIDHYDCEIDRSGYGSSSDILVLLSAVGGQYQFRYNGGVLKTGAADYVFGPASTGDKVALRGVDVSFGTSSITTTLFYSGDVLGEFYIGSCIVRSPNATGAVVEVGTTNWASWPNVITSEGGNIFTSDFNADDRVARAANPAGGIANMAEFIAAIDPTGRDVTEAAIL